MADNTATNDITNDRIVTKRSTTYADNYAKIAFSVKLDNARQSLNEFSSSLDHLNELLKDPIDGFNNEDK